MTRAEAVQVHAAALRAAVSSGDFTRAEQSAELYAAAFRSWVPEVPSSQAPALAAQAQELLQWAWRNLCAHRARLASRLRDAQRLARYHTQPPVSPHTWTIQG